MNKETKMTIELWMRRNDINPTSIETRGLQKGHQEYNAGQLVMSKPIISFDGIKDHFYKKRLSEVLSMQPFYRKKEDFCEKILKSTIMLPVFYVGCDEEDATITHPLDGSNHPDFKTTRTHFQHFLDITNAEQITFTLDTGKGYEPDPNNEFIDDPKWRPFPRDGKGNLRFPTMTYRVNLDMLEYQILYGVPIYVLKNTKNGMKYNFWEKCLTSGVLYRSMPGDISGSEMAQYSLAYVRYHNPLNIKE